MLRTILTIATCSLIITLANSQSKVGSNVLNIDPASMLEVESDSSGILPPRLTTAQRDAQTEWDEGHIIYNSTDHCLQVFNGTAWDCFVQGVQIDSTIYKYNDTLTSDRIVGMGGFQLTFDGSGDVVITAAGFVGIGDPTPEAKLDVQGGTVRLSDYGKGDITGSESYLLGVDSEGDIIEVTPAIDTFSLFGDELRISLKGDTVSYDSVNLAKYLDDINVFEDEGTLTGNRTMSLDGNWFRMLGTDSGANIQFQDDGDIRQYGPGVLHQLVDTSGRELRLFSGSTSYISALTDVALTLRQNNENTIGLLANDYLRFYDYGAGSRVGTPTFILGVDADGDVLDVDANSLGTDNQILDSLGLTGTTLEVGIEDDVNGLQSIDLSSINTDNQILDSLGLTGTTLEVGIEDDANGLQSIDLSSINTDNQILDSLGLTGTTLEVGIEDDANGLQSIDLSSINTDNQILDSLGLTGTTLEVGIEGDPNGLQTLDLSSLQDGTGSDSQGIDVLGYASGTLSISLDDDGETTQTVDISGVDTDEQVIDSLGLDGNTLNIGLEGDANGLQSVDLSPILGSSENIYNTSDALEADRVVTMDGNNLTFDGTGTGDLVIHSDGDISIGTATASGDLNVVSDEDQDAFHFTQDNGTTGEKDVFTIEDQDVGGGGQDESSVLKVIKSGTISGTDDGFSLVELANTSTDPGDNKYWISGRKVDEGAPLWGVDITDNDYWSKGGIVLGVTGADGGTYSGGTFIVEPDGDVGIGTTTPGARLEVTGGSVIFDEYGVGTYEKSDTGSVKYLLGVDTSGAVVELNTAQNTRWFYPPAIVIDASDLVTAAMIDMYGDYKSQFSMPLISNPEADGSVPYYDMDELDYYITDYDTTVLDNITIDANGVMTYDIIAVPFDNYTVINVVFVIKEEP